MITQSDKTTPVSNSGSHAADSEEAPPNATDGLADRIYQRAYEINKAHSINPYPDIRDWVQAEREIRAESGQPEKTQK
jgi:hypothetical protein